MIHVISVLWVFLDALTILLGFPISQKSFQMLQLPVGIRHKTTRFQDNTVQYRTTHFPLITAPQHLQDIIPPAALGHYLGLESTKHTASTWLFALLFIGPERLRNILASPSAHPKSRVQLDNILAAPISQQQLFT